ncbi:T9SS type A sorting domain-containing protein [Chishuiella changwenlii]|uniref:T9SS type A sorting domain-containing protein n=1 Tax=Chishuiella changwenlii TaxID=1434701 RepID=UPI002FDA4D24
MKKFILFLILLLSSYSFSQTDSQSDRTALFSLLNKFGKYNSGHENLTLNEMKEVKTRVINNEIRITEINLRSSGSFYDRPIENPEYYNGMLDISSELSEMSNLTSVILAPNSYLSNIITKIDNRLFYTVDFSLLNNLTQLENFSFIENFTLNNIFLMPSNLEEINKLEKLTKLKLDKINTLYGSQLIEIPEFKYVKNLEILNGTIYSNTIVFKQNNILENLKLDFNGDYTNNYFEKFTNLKSLSLKGNYSSIPSSLGNLTTLESLTLTNYVIPKLPSTITNLQNLNSIFYSGVHIRLNDELKNLAALRELTIAADITSFYRDVNIYNNEVVNDLTQLKKLTIALGTKPDIKITGFDFEKLINLEYLDYNINMLYAYDESNHQNYVLPKNIDKLVNLEDLRLTLGNETQDISNLTKLKRLYITYNYNQNYPKIDFSENVNLENLDFTINFSNDLKNVKSFKIEEKDFKKLNKLNNINFQTIPVEIAQANTFNSIKSLKTLFFSDYNSSKKNNFQEKLNLCNLKLESIDFLGTAPKIIDIRNNTPNYIDLMSFDDYSPQLIVDDINNFKQVYGESYFDNLKFEDVPFNLATSSEPCEAALSTNNLTKPNLKIYPNPVLDILNIESDVNKNIIRIFDLMGNLVESYDVKDKSISIMVNQLPKGIYIVEIENEKGKTNSKFIKK